MKIIKKIWKFIKIILVLGFLLVEQLFWEKFAKPFYEALALHHFVDDFRVWVSNVQNKYFLLVLFIIPFILMEVCSTYGLILMGAGHVEFGAFLYSLKLVLTFPVVIIFNVGKDILTEFFIIRYVYGSILRFKRSRTFRGVKRTVTEVYEEVGNLFGTSGTLFGLRPIYNTLRRKQG